MASPQATVHQRLCWLVFDVLILVSVAWGSYWTAEMVSEMFSPGITRLNLQIRPDVLLEPVPRCRILHVFSCAMSLLHCKSSCFRAVYRDGSGMGGGGLRPLGDTFVLDTEANEWRWPETSDDSQPLPRNAATMNCAGDQLVFYGGWQAFVETYNDTWLLQL